VAKRITKDSPKTPAELSGLRKTAILLVALPAEASAAVLKKLPRQTVEEITREIASIGEVDAGQRTAVIREFYNVALAAQYTESGGLAYARALLERTTSKEEAARLTQQIESSVCRHPFSFLHQAESENLLEFIQDEHPQTIALILAHLPGTKASEILSGLPAARQLEVVTRVARMEQTNPEVIKEVEKGLEHRLGGLMAQTFQRVGGVEAVAGILNLSDRATEKSIMEALESEDPDLVEQIRRLMFVFEDILLVNDKGIQAVLKEIETDELALALRTASDELRDKVFRNMSERAVQLLKEDMEYMGPVRLSDVEAAQQKIVDVVRRLEDAGEIIISGRGGAQEVIV